MSSTEPLWTEATMQAKADELFKELEAMCTTPLERRLARDNANLHVAIWQIHEALAANSYASGQAARLARETAAVHRVQGAAFSERLEQLERSEND